MAANVWKKAYNATIVINAVTTYAIQEFSYQEQVSQFDATNITSATNSASLLADEHDVDTIKTTFSGAFLVKATEILTLKTGRSYAISYTSADGDVHSGFGTILQRTKPVATRGGYRVSFSGEFSGVVAGQ